MQFWDFRRTIGSEIIRKCIKLIVNCSMIFLLFCNDFYNYVLNNDSAFKYFTKQMTIFILILMLSKTIFCWWLNKFVLI